MVFKDPKHYDLGNANSVDGPDNATNNNSKQ